MYGIAWYILPLWILVHLYGFHVGKYTSSMDARDFLLPKNVMQVGGDEPLASWGGVDPSLKTLATLSGFKMIGLRFSFWNGPFSGDMSFFFWGGGGY